jgi:hypothetical protein
MAAFAEALRMLRVNDRIDKIIGDRQSIADLFRYRRPV